MTGNQFVADRAMIEGAAELMARFGAAAGREASSRADHSRDVGNVVHFCRWREVERLIAILSIEEPFGTIH